MADPNTAPDTIDLSSHVDAKPVASPDTISLAPTGNEKPLENTPDDGFWSGAAKNLGTAAVKGVSHIPGIVGDLRDMAGYVSGRAIAGISGTPSEEVFKQQAENERKRRAGTPAWASVPQAPSGHDIATPVLEKTGEYTPTTPTGRAGSMAVEGGLAMLGPGGIGGGMKAAGEGAMKIARGVLGGGAKAVPGGAAAGVVGDEVAQLTGDPLYGMAASMAVPGAGMAAKHATKDIAAPFIPRLHQILADRRLTQGATNPEAAVDAMKARAPKEGETLGEATLDPGLLQTEKAAANTSRSFQEHLANRDIARNADTVSTINALAPAADTMAPSKLFRQRLADIETLTQDATARALKEQETARAALPPGAHADDTGAALRDIAAKADKAKGAMIDKVYNSIDPDGTMHLVTEGPAKFAQDLKASINPEVEIPSPLASPVIDMVANLKPVTSFADLRKLDKTITAKMSEAARAGDRTGHGQLVALKSEVMNAIDNALENQSKWEQSAVSRGDIKGEETLVGRLKSRTDQHADAAAEAEAGRSVATGSAEPGATSTTQLPHQDRSRSEAGRGPGISQGTPSLPEPNIGPEAAALLAEGKALHADRAQTFRQGPVGQALKTNGFAGQYTALNAKVPDTAFGPGKSGYENTQAWLRAGAGDPATVPTLQEAATNSLRAAMKGGDLTPEALVAWKRNHEPALRALEEAAPGSGFLDKFSTAAKATETVAEAAALGTEAVKRAQQGAAAKFLKLTSPGEVGDTLLGMARSGNGPTQLAALWNTMDATARAGARRALTETILREHQNGNGALSGPSLRKFITKNTESLMPVYGPDGMRVLSGLADDVTRYQQASSLQRSKTGSDSFANFMRWAKENTGHATNISLGTALMLAGGDALVSGNFGHLGGIIGIGVVKHLYSTMRANGIRKIDDLVELGMTNPEVGAAMLQRGLDNKGSLKVEAWDNLNKALLRAAADRETLDEHARVGRATGGSVKVDHAAHAARLVRLVGEARKETSKATEPMLKLPDATVSRALAIANERLA